MERDRAQATHRSKEHCLTATSAEDVWDMTRDVRSCRMLIHAHLQREILVVRGNRSSKQGRSNCVGLTTDEDICVSERKKASKCVSRGEASFVITRELSGRAKVASMGLHANVPLGVDVRHGCVRANHSLAIDLGACKYVFANRKTAEPGRCDGQREKSENTFVTCSHVVATLNET